MVGPSIGCKDCGQDSKHALLPPYVRPALPNILAAMIEDPGEIAQLASEFVSSLDNIPQEVQHIIKEIEHKDAKVQGG